MAARSDVLIGAGPAGFLLGYLLARRGFDVTIIDKAAFPRDKVCGDGLSNKALELLPFDVAPVVSAPRAGCVSRLPERGGTVKEASRLGTRRVRPPKARDRQLA